MSKEESLKPLSHSCAVWKKKQITATGVVAGIGPGDVFGGIITQAVGTTTTLTAYDDASAVAANLLLGPTTTGNTNVVGAFTSPFGGAGGLATTAPSVNAGLILTTGLYITIGGTGSPTFWVLYH